MNPLSLLPSDAHNQRLAANVHPAGWVNPPPASRYNLVVIGAGTAGLVIAAGAAGLGAKVALIERDLMGGDCLNFGCVPSKAMIRASRAAAGIRDAARFGVRPSEHAGVDFGAVMERMRRLRADLSVNDSANRFRSLGVDVFLGDARFSGHDTVMVGEMTLRFRRAAIATGARAAELPIAGLEGDWLPHQRNRLRADRIAAADRSSRWRSARMRTGASVPPLRRRSGATRSGLANSDSRGSRCRCAGRAALLDDGINLIAGCKVTGVERREAEKLIRFTRDGAAGELVVDEIIVGVGRAPAVNGLNLEAAGVKYDQITGVAVDDYLRTANHKIYAVGDICSPFKFTHVADAMARIVIRNALFYGRARMSALTIPWCTYTDPEIAHVGLYETDATARGLEVKTFVQEFKEADRAILDGETDGMMKVIVAAGSDHIVGATIVASHASEMISEITPAITRVSGSARSRR